MSKERVEMQQEEKQPKKRKKKYGCLKGFLVLILFLLIIGGVVYGAAHKMLSNVIPEKRNGCDEHRLIRGRLS